MNSFLNHSSELKAQGKTSLYVRACKYTRASHSFFPQVSMHLSPGHEWLLWITSTTLCSPSPFPVKGGGRRAKKSRHRWIPFLQPLPACGGQDAIGSALRASWSCSLSNRKQERQTAEPCSEACVRLCETEASTVCGTCSARSPAPSGTQQQGQCKQLQPRTPCAWRGSFLRAD